MGRCDLRRAARHHRLGAFGGRRKALWGRRHCIHRIQRAHRGRRFRALWRRRPSGRRRCRAIIRCSRRQRAYRPDLPQFRLFSTENLARRCRRTRHWHVNSSARGRIHPRESRRTARRLGAREIAFEIAFGAREALAVADPSHELIDARHAHDLDVLSNVRVELSFMPSEVHPGSEGPRCWPVTIHAVAEVEAQHQEQHAKHDGRHGARDQVAGAKPRPCSWWK